jgi:Zn-dependent protease
MNCQKCGQETLMPFQCPYCGGRFCTDHRLPENHACPNLGLAHAQRQEVVADSFAPKRNSYEFSLSFGGPRQTRGRLYMGRVELKHLIPAALLIIGVGFSIVLYNSFFGDRTFDLLGWGWTETSVFALLLTASFLIHELAHKFTAQKYGLWAEFRLTKWGAIVTLISVFTPFRLISPGAVMISGPATLKGIGKISIAGPITNISLALTFLGLTYAPVPIGYAYLFLLIASFNAFIAVFNLVPFGILDGFKIYSWNKTVWAATFALCAALTVYTYFFAAV